MKIHFIGIGGIGVSALAKYYLSEGLFVSGSDAAESGIIEELRRLGAEIPPSLPFQSGEEMRHRKENLPADTDLVVYSAAVPQDNPELVEAKKRGIKCQTYAQALGELTKKYFTIAVSGTHGKSTTTAMIALILAEAGLDPTVIVGTKVRWNEKIPPTPPLLKGGEDNPSNFRAGKSKYLVIEADEYAASFLNYWPKIIILTNIEEDHLDYYGNLKNIMKAFKAYVTHLPKDGVLVANREDKNILEIVQSSKFKVKSYDSKFRIDSLKLKVAGRHNLMDAYAAISAARALGIPDKTSVKTLNKFNGTWRRMEYKGKVNGAKIYDDYGHHPTEIKATLEAAAEIVSALSRSPKGTAIQHRQGPRAKGRRNFGSGKLWCVFQPHQYQRTYQLFDRFTDAFDEADVLILLPIYSVAGREKESIKKRVSSEKLAEAVKVQSSKFKVKSYNGKLKNKEIIYLDSFDKAVEYLRQNLKSGDTAVIMGAGDVYKLTVALFS